MIPWKIVTLPNNVHVLPPFKLQTADVLEQRRGNTKQINEWSDPSPSVTTQTKPSQCS